MCFNGIFEGGVAVTAFINDLSKLSEGVITEIKSFSKQHNGKKKESSVYRVLYWRWIWNTAL